MAELREEARDLARPLELPLIGSDTNVTALDGARANAEQAGIQLNLRAAPLSSAMPSADTGSLVTNPPYGERLARDSDLPQQLSAVLRRFAHYQRALIVPRGFDLPPRADRFLLVFNGAIECELRRWEAVRD